MKFSPDQNRTHLSSKKEGKPILQGQVMGESRNIGPLGASLALPPAALSPEQILQMQKTLGNHAVAQLMQTQQPVSQLAKFHWTADGWQLLEGEVDDGTFPYRDGEKIGEIFDTEYPPRSREKRKRTAAKKYDDMVDDEEVDQLIGRNPEGFGLQEEELEQFREEIHDAENIVDDSEGASKHGISGSSRADKGDDALARWFLRFRPKDSLNTIIKLLSESAPTRHSVVDRDDFSVSSRIPGQGASLAHLPMEALWDFAKLSAWFEMGDGEDIVRERLIRAIDIYEELRKDVSANKVFGHEKQKGGMDYQGYEILHMAGRAVGDPTIDLSLEEQQEIYGEIEMDLEDKNYTPGSRFPSMSEWQGHKDQTGRNYAPAQHPLNLALGSYGANTMMMAIEGAVEKVTKDFILITRAFAPEGFNKHIAWHIVMTLIHKPTGESRFYYIPGMANVAPLEVYEHMRADALRFIEAEAHEKGKDSVYEYPTMEEILIEREKAIEKAKKNGEKQADDSSGSGEVEASSKDTGGLTQIVVDSTTLHRNVTAGGGNCFFHAIFEAVNNARSDMGTQQVMRETVVQVFQQNAALANTHFGVQGVHAPAFQQFATAILTEGNWIGNQTPSYVADALRWRIVIHNPDGSIYFDAQPNPHFGAAQQTVHICYNGVHYDSYTQQPLG